MRNKRKTQEGYSLIELIVTMGVFTVLVVIVIGAFTNALVASGRAQSIKQVNSNVSLALELMSREIRAAEIIHCGLSGDWSVPKYCPEGDTTIVLERAGGDLGSNSDQVIFRIENGVVQRSVNGGSSYEDLTSSNVGITQLSFAVNNLSGGGADTPNVTIQMGAESGEGRRATELNTQTSVVQAEKSLGETVIRYPVGTSGCSLRKDFPDEIVIDFEELKDFYSTISSAEPSATRWWASESRGPYPLPGGIQSRLDQNADDGVTYDIWLEAFDAHCEIDDPSSCDDNQAWEQFYVEFHNAGNDFSDPIYTSPPTEDIPPNVNMHKTKVASGVSLPSGIRSVWAHIDEGANEHVANSHIPVCAVLVAGESGASGSIDIDEF